MGRFFQRKTVSWSQRQDNIVFAGSSLEFEVKAATKAFTEGQSPGAIDTGTKRRMDNEMHVPGFIEEAFKYDTLLAWYHTQRGLRRCQISD